MPDLADLLSGDLGADVLDALKALAMLMPDTFLMLWMRAQVDAQA
jgi:hypothetical protein